MSTPDFLVVFSGAALDGFDPVTVQAQVEAALHLTEDQSGKLFSFKHIYAPWAMCTHVMLLKQLCILIVHWKPLIWKITFT